MGDIRIGRVSSIDYAAGRARIVYEDRGDSTTAEFPFLAWEYDMPGIGDRVVVAHLSSGSSSAVILGPVWTRSHRPIDGHPGLWRKDFGPGAYIQYDADDRELIISAGGCVATLASGTLTVLGDLLVSRDLVVQGSISTSGDLRVGGINHATHTHMTAEGATSPPVGGPG